MGIAAQRVGLVMALQTVKIRLMAVILPVMIMMVVIVLKMTAVLQEEIIPLVQVVTVCQTAAWKTTIVVFVVVPT